MSYAVDLAALIALEAIWLEAPGAVAADLSNKVRAALDAKDAEIKRLRESRHAFNLNCLDQRNKALELVDDKDAEIARLQAALDGQLALNTPLVNENFRLRDEFEALRAAVLALPEVGHVGLCPIGNPAVQCVCGADGVNAARAAARLLAGSEG